MSIRLIPGPRRCAGAGDWSRPPEVCASAKSGIIQTPSFGSDQSVPLYNGKDHPVNIKISSALLLLFFGFAACVSQDSWTPVVDTANDPNDDRLASDEKACRQLAKKGAHTAKQTGEGAVEGGAVGTLAGAAVGAILGVPGEGAAIGATMGGTSGGTKMARDSNADFKRIFSNCLRERGHPVLN